MTVHLLLCFFTIIAICQAVPTRQDSLNKNNRPDDLYNDSANVGQEGNSNLLHSDVSYLDNSQLLATNSPYVGREGNFKDIPLIPPKSILPFLPNYYNQIEPGSKSDLQTSWILFSPMKIRQTTYVMDTDTETENGEKELSPSKSGPADILNNSQLTDAEVKTRFGYGGFGGGGGIGAGAQVGASVGGHIGGHIGGGIGGYGYGGAHRYGGFGHPGFHG